MSKWFKQESFPQPDKLLRIGMLLGLAFESLVNMPPSTAVPIVTFRRKAHRKTKDAHLDNARETGELLKRLVPYLPAQALTQPPVLKDPSLDYDYVQQVAAEARKEMGLEGKKVLEFEDLIDKFNRLHAVLIPALWGAQEQHGNALNIYLPDSQTTWVFLNLDSNAVDFKFWMAHELGHSLAPTLSGETSEDFADRFAQALLFPAAHAAQLYNDLSGIPGVSAKLARLRSEAEKHIISPYTIRRAVEAYAQARRLPPVDLGNMPLFMGMVWEFLKKYCTITTALFKTGVPEPHAYAAIARTTFKSPFFEALTGFCKSEQGAEHFIHRVLGVSLADAKALSGQLQK